MKVVLPIAALLAILFTATLVPSSQEAPADLEGAPAPAAVTPWSGAYDDAYPVAFDPFTGWGVADLPGASVRGPEGPSVTALQVVEVDAFERYGVEAPPHPWEALAAPAPGPGALVPLAEVRAQYGDPGADALAGALADALPAASTGPAATGAWWDAAPLDAK